MEQSIQEVHFESALSQNEKDAWAESLMEQTLNYKKAKSLQEEEQYEEAIEKAEKVIANKEGSEAIAEKAKTLIDESQDKIDGVLSFEDFMGYYLHFSENDPSVADMLLTISEKEMRFYYLRSDYFIDEILSKKIDGDELSLELYSEASEQDSEEYARAKFKYIESEDEVKLLNNDLIFQKAPYEALEKYDFVIEDIVND